jgi:hypothetical protein
MSIKLGTEARVTFALLDAETGLQVDASAISGSARKNGAVDVLAVTITKIGTGLYTATCTPSVGASFTAGDRLTVIVAATVSGNNYNLPVLDEVLASLAVGDAVSIAADGLSADSISLAALNKMCKIMGIKSSVSADGTVIKYYDTSGTLIVTLTATGTNPVVWTPVWE